MKIHMILLQDSVLAAQAALASARFAFILAKALLRQIGRRADE